jgi:hypothetical protein
MDNEAANAYQDIATLRSGKGTVNLPVPSHSAQGGLNIEREIKCLLRASIKAQGLQMDSTKVTLLIVTRLVPPRNWMLDYSFPRTRNFWLLAHRASFPPRRGCPDTNKPGMFLPTRQTFHSLENPSQSYQHHVVRARLTIFESAAT